jgi:pimeloyl-ACP methyl ester carboxylesterase
MPPHPMRRLLAITVLAVALPAASARAALHVTWMKGFAAAGTPARYDKVGVLKIGPAGARNVLVLEPGTSAGSAYFVPLAKWVVRTVKGWQVWAVERRENLLEDQSMLNLAKEGKLNGAQLFDYYLGWLSNPAVAPHFRFIANSSVEFAKRWGMRVAVEDLHRVIAAARKLGGKVVLGGHSLGGAVVTAYATWSFRGHPGGDELAGLVYIDGGSPAPDTAAKARAALSNLDSPTASPWLTFGPFPAPLAGLFNATGSVGALIDPNGPSIGQMFSLLPSYLKPSVPVTNLAQYGFALDVGSSPPTLIAAQAHLGRGVGASATGGYHGWDGSGALTPIRRYAQMFAGAGIVGTDGTEWYFPQRLTDDTLAVGNGIANPAQNVLDVHSTMGRHLSRRLLLYVFGTALGDGRVLTAARLLAKESRIPARNLVLIDHAETYAHNDPVGAWPDNAFFTQLVAFLRRVSAGAG